jgi:hypothetical protein
MNNKIALTFDIDWATDPVVEFLLNILDKNNLIKATLFCTHKSRIFKKLDKSQYEIAIHPNFNRTFAYKERIEELLEIFPGAKGIRSHGLLSSTNILLEAQKAGLEYEVNTFLPKYTGMYVTDRFPGFKMIPYNYSDSHYLITKADQMFDDDVLSREGLQVFTFHPIHIFINTKNIEHYESIKSIYKIPEELVKLINKEIGVRTHFLKLIEMIQRNNIQTYTCSELIKK